MKKQIDSYEAACEALKLDPVAERPCKGDDLTPKQIWLNAVNDMATILDALHIGVKGKRIWYPVFYNPKPDNSGFGFAYSYTRYDDTYSVVGARLKCATEELSDYSAKQFLPLHKIIQLG